eukprot:TRINITY_DN102884_c0_g1_i1.p1 TRINITY_DN102884_c0_g1~~TRINITY_DN102884_c0_g1_i1.p1  ORF type:complete len:373 (+),score=51.10 TRINITY_DN102884_c0_g1_i1:40-1158(+)
MMNPTVLLKQNGCFLTPHLSSQLLHSRDGGGFGGSRLGTLMGPACTASVVPRLAGLMAAAVVVLKHRRYLFRCCNVAFPCRPNTQRNATSSSSKASSSSSDGCFEVVPIEGKGLGIVATRDIARGERVISETPAITWRAQDFSYTEDIQRQWDKLSDAQKVLVMDLHCAGERNLENILRGCAYPQGQGSEDWALGIIFCRFNHSCIPNLEQSWDGEAFKLEAYACTDIRAGEEMCTFYIDPREPRSERALQLQRGGNFECRCAACIDADGSHEQGRADIIRLGRETWSGKATASKKLQTLKEILDIYDRLDIHPQSFRRDVYEKAFELLRKTGDSKRAKECLERALDCSKMCRGVRHRETLRLSQRVDSLQV